MSGDVQVAEDFVVNDFLNSSGKRKISTAAKGKSDHKTNFIAQEKS